MKISDIFEREIMTSLGLMNLHGCVPSYSLLLAAWKSEDLNKMLGLLTDQHGSWVS